MRCGALALALAVLALGCGGEEGMDAGPADAGAGDAGALDAGVDAAAPMCDEHIVDPYAGAPPCSVGTRECARACPDLGCAKDCVDADPATACGDCWAFNTQSCWNRNGCQDEWNCLSQCLLASCPGGITTECLTVTCGAQDMAYADCFEPLRMMCGMRGADCFPPL